LGSQQINYYHKLKKTTARYISNDNLGFIIGVNMTTPYILKINNRRLKRVATDKHTAVKADTSLIELLKLRYCSLNADKLSIKY
jgi:hypothetical protein